MVGIGVLTISRSALDRALGWNRGTLLPTCMITTAMLGTIFSRTPLLSLGGSTWRRFGLPGEVALALFIFLQTSG
jgi:hypothetical protein